MQAQKAEGEVLLLASKRPFGFCWKSGNNAWYECIIKY